jgi:hypothetical protein
MAIKDRELVSSSITTNIPDFYSQSSPKVWEFFYPFFVSLLLPSRNTQNNVVFFKYTSHKKAPHLEELDFDHLAELWLL